MVGSSKILTVSYGTFSCTLEGFDDSFDSMKAIAEYFRDLAQEDRYFGAEPPTPDAEMLARIAEREISRRVEAQMDDRGVHLRAAAPVAAYAALDKSAETTPAAEEAAADPEPAAQATPAPIAAETHDDAADTAADANVAMPPEVSAPEVAPLSAAAFMAPQSAPAAPAVAAPPPAAAHDPSSIAAKLRRIRSVVAEPDPEVEDIEEASAYAIPDVSDAGAAPESSVDTDDSTADDEQAEAVTDEDAAPVAADLDDEDDVLGLDESEVSAVAEPTAEDVIAAADAEVEDEFEVVDDAIAIADATDDAEDDTAEVAEDDDSAVAAPAEAVEDNTADDADEDGLGASIADVIAAAHSQGDADDAPEQDVVEDAVADDAEDDTASNAIAAVEAMLNTPEDDDVEGTTAETADDDSLAAEDAAWAQAALDADAGTDEDTDLSSDLNDTDPIAPTISSVAGPARIVRIRKDGPAEIITMGDDDAEDGLNIALKTEYDAPTQDVAEDVAEAIAEDTVVGDAVMEEPAQADDAAEDEVTAVTETAPAARSGHDDIRAAIAAAMPTGSLSDDDEEDLQRELAAVAEEVVVLEDDDEPEIAEVAVTDVVEDDNANDHADAPSEIAAQAEEATETDTQEPEPELEPEIVHSRPRRRLPDADYAVTRMITQTDEALNEPAGSRRRNAIAQLKAAVAATEAARQLGDDSRKHRTEENAFRNDLNEVVRPSQIIEADAEKDRPRAAPLKLVASQRVDEDDKAQKAASKPIDSEYGGFAQFAASMGATDLPDLLEAAAAYTSFVEGVEDFSRPQIMKKVQMTTTEEFSREDGLRSFGTLLRQGRISKVRNGRFQVSEQTRFRPDARSA